MTRSFFFFFPQAPEEERRHGFVGLHNFGCTCYINALLQQLAFVPRLRADLMQLSDTAVEAAATAAVDTGASAAVGTAPLQSSSETGAEKGTTADSVPVPNGGQIVEAKASASKVRLLCWPSFPKMEIWCGVCACVCACDVQATRASSLLYQLQAALRSLDRSQARAFFLGVGNMDELGFRFPC